jgi:hypothetical protein
MVQKTTDQLGVGDIVLDGGMRIKVGAPIPTHREGVWAFKGHVLNADALCDKDSPDYDSYIACHLRGQWWKDRDPNGGKGDPADRDMWPIQGTANVVWYLGLPWEHDGSMIVDAGDIGGDVQVGMAASQRFLNTRLGGRVYDVSAYPVEKTEGPDNEKVIVLEVQTQMTVCTDVTQPGDTEKWADIEYSDLPERYDITYGTVELAEAAAQELIRTFDPDRYIGWDGYPKMGAPSILQYGDLIERASGPLDTAKYGKPTTQAKIIVDRNNDLENPRVQMNWDSDTIEGADGKQWTVTWLLDAANGWVMAVQWAEASE